MLIFFIFTSLSLFGDFVIVDVIDVVSMVVKEEKVLNLLLLLLENVIEPSEKQKGCVSPILKLRAKL